MILYKENSNTEKTRRKSSHIENGSEYGG